MRSRGLCCSWKESFRLRCAGGESRVLTRVRRRDAPRRPRRLSQLSPRRRRRAPSRSAHRHPHREVRAFPAGTPGPAAHGDPSNWRSPSAPCYRACRRTASARGAQAMAHGAFGGGTGVSDLARRAFGHDGGRASQVGIVATAKTVVVGPGSSSVFVHFPHRPVHFCTGLFLAPGGIMLVDASPKEDPSEASAHCRRRCSARQQSSLADGRPVDRNAGGAGREAQEDQQASGASRRTHGNHQTKTHLIESFHTNDSRPLEHGKSDVPPSVSSTTTAEAAHR
jgi:hypothetical protein